MSAKTDVPLLTARQAETLYHDCLDRGCVVPLHSIATERARVCPVRTEAEWREEFRNQSLVVIGSQFAHEDTWLAALRHLNLVAPENGK